MNKKDQSKRYLTIRQIKLRDLGEILDIENQSQENLWNEDNFFENLKQENCNGLVLTSLDQIYGFIIYEKFTDHIEVLNLGVLESERRQGIGSLLLEKVKTKLHGPRRTMLYYVRERNLAGHLLLQKNKFTATGVERNYYWINNAGGSTREDAYCFAYSLDPFWSLEKLKKGK